jgi:hypothetical protein
MWSLSATEEKQKSHALDGNTEGRFQGFIIRPPGTRELLSNGVWQTDFARCRNSKCRVVHAARTGYEKFGGFNAKLIIE